METTDQVQAIRDEEHLRLLSICYFIAAGLNCVFAIFGLVYVAMGLVMVYAPQSFQGNANGPPPAQFGWIMFGIGVGISSALLILAILKLLAGFALRKRRHRTLAFIAAGLSCLEVPYGTLLGVFTFIVLGRRSVAALFAAPGRR